MPTPTSSAPNGASSESPSHPVAPNQPPIVLVVEDEVLIRMATAADFRNKGFTVLEAGNGDDAKAMIETHPEIGVVFTDLVLPGCSGLELAQYAKTVRPTLPVLVATAHVVMINPNVAAQCCAGVIHKPYNMQRVIDHVRWLAETPPQPAH